MSSEIEEPGRADPPESGEPVPGKSEAFSAVALVEQMVAAGERPEPELLRRILKQGEAAVGPLVKVLQTMPRPRGWPAEAVPLNAAGLLSELRSPEAIPALCAAARDYKSELAESLASALAAYGPEAFDPLMGLIQDPAVSGYQRSYLIEAAKRAAGKDPARRARLAEVLRGLFRETRREIDADRAFEDELLAAAKIAPDETDDLDVEDHDAIIEDLSGQDEDDIEGVEAQPALDLEESSQESPVGGDKFADPDELDNLTERYLDLTFLTCDLADLADTESLDLIREAFSSELIDETIIDLPFVEEKYKEGGEIYLLPTSWIKGYEKDYREYMETLDLQAYLSKPALPTIGSHRAVRGDDLERPPRMEMEAAQPIRNAGPRIGRNDPCWCGSGKKYKKCHMGKETPK